MAAGEVRYASTGEAQIAYRISDGDGPVLVALSGSVPDLRAREQPMTVDYYERIEGFARLLLIDPRGTGRSDPLPSDGLTTETTVADLDAVIDHAGLERVDLWGFHSGGLTAMAYAATRPERVDRLILTNTWARTLRADDQPWGISEAFSEQLIEEHRRHIGDGQLFADAFVPSRRGDPHVAQWFADIEGGISRAQSVALTRWSQNADVRAYLPRIQAPTLVLQTSRNPAIPAEHGRYLATTIPDVTYLEIDGVDHAFPISDLWEVFVDEIERFITGATPSRPADRIFATVLFTDIVGSTERVGSMGDAAWKLALADHDRVTRETVERLSGQVVKSTGDGVLAVFDVPSRAVRAAAELVRHFRGSSTPVRAGLHAGEIERRGDDVAGIAVHLAQRVCGQAGDSEVLVSRSVPDLVLGSGLTFTDRGTFALKGLAEPMQLWSVG
jgi:class 3 adenylate cyclase/pimeloyl-ACP methyl ester carboxylesterase